MNDLFFVTVSVSLAASVLIGILLLAEHLFKNRIRWTYWYWLWALVVIRLLVPVGPVTDNNSASWLQDAGATYTASQDVSVQPETDMSDTEIHAEDSGMTMQPDLMQILGANLWVIWLTGAVVLLVRRVTAFQSFNRCIRAGMQPCDNLELLNVVAEAAEELHIRRPIELSVNRIISSPLLFGWRHPCIVLPSEEYSTEELRSIALHELIHLKRGDALYKWVIQVSVCVHWFNPLVHYMARRISRLCELSCDELVMHTLGEQSARSYGHALLHAMGGAGRFEAAAGSMELSANKKLIQERILRLKEHADRKPYATILAILLVGVIALCTACTQVYSPWQRSAGRIGNRSKYIEEMGDADLRIDAQDVWFELEASNGDVVEIDADDTFHKVMMHTEGNRTVINLASQPDADTNMDPILVRVPKDTVGLMEVHSESCVSQIPASAFLSKNMTITALDSCVFVCSEANFAGIEVEADLDSSFIVRPEEFAEHESMRAGSGTLFRSGENASILLSASSSLVVFDENGMAQALSEAAQEGLRNPGVWLEYLQEFMPGLSENIADVASRQTPDPDFISPDPSVEQIYADTGRVGHSNTGISSFAEDIREMILDIRTEIGNLLNNIKNDLVSLAW